MLAFTVQIHPPSFSLLLCPERLICSGMSPWGCPILRGFPYPCTHRQNTPLLQALLSENL